jgi:rubrerythrin
MTAFGSIEEILDFAIAGESTSYQLYRELAKRAENEQMQKVLAEFAQEELGHRAKLEELREKKRPVIPAERISELKIADYVSEAAPDSETTYQDVLVFAMKKEKASFRLYSGLAELAEDKQLREMFQWLAQEEAKHKLRFEIEYDDLVLKED